MARLKRSDVVNKRTAFIGANVSLKERAEIERRAALVGRRLADYIRMMVLSSTPGAQPQPKLAPDVARQIAFELARIGGNLNQLSYHANATRTLPVRDAIDETLNEIVKATEMLTRL